MIKFSKSKLNTCISCGEKNRIHYELGIRARKTSNTLVEGSCIHHLVETGIVYGGEITDVLEQASIGFWREHPFERCAYESEEDYLKAQAISLAQSREFLDLIGAQHAQAVELHIERPLIHPLTGEGHMDIILNGFIDLVLTGENGRPLIVDLKTVARMPQTGMSRLALELSMYAYLMEEDLPVNEITRTNVALVYLVRTKLTQLHWDSSFRTLHHLAGPMRRVPEGRRGHQPGRLLSEPRDALLLLRLQASVLPPARTGHPDFRGGELAALGGRHAHP